MLLKCNKNFKYSYVVRSYIAFCKTESQSYTDKKKVKKFKKSTFKPRF
jgi:hypothetical protein